MRKLLFGLFAAVVLVVGIVLIRTILLSPPTLATITPVSIDLDEDLIANHLAQAIRFKTVSHGDPRQWEKAPFDGFIQWVSETYPEVETNLEKTLLNETILYKWGGSDASLAPILVTGHYDVVPVIPGTEDDWHQPPYAGVIQDGVIWGRGALDDKSGVIGILEAATYLLKNDFQPTRTVYLSFGHDEEIGGTNGAGKVAEYLSEKNVQLAWSLDEGSFLLDGLFPGINVPVAAINVAEKGYMTLEITARGQGGHSSMPPQDTAVTTLARALVTLQENPLPGGLEGLALEMFERLTPYMEFSPRFLFANQWLFGAAIESQLSAAPTTNAMIRTTTAPTMLEGSIKDNVLPIAAKASVNFRLHPRDTTESVKDYVEGLIGSDVVKVETVNGNNASVVSSWESEGFELIGRSVQEVYGDVAVTPGLMVAGSDSRHYGKVADDAYRFNPFPVTQDDIAGFHGTNENVKVENLVNGVKSYIQIIRYGSGN